MSRIGDIDAGTYDVDTMVPLSRMEAILLKIAEEGGGGGGGSEVRKHIVDVLPDPDDPTIDEGAIYLVPGANPTEGNQYDEYIHTPNGWEMISTADDGDIPDDYINNLWS